jgi:hypothetical protein
MNRKPAKSEPKRDNISAGDAGAGGTLRQLLTERYRERLAGVLSCYDRIIVTRTLPGDCYAKRMMGLLSARIRVFDYPRFAEPLRDRVRDHRPTPALLRQRRADGRLQAYSPTNLET